jgi:hypothetical protein
MKLLKGIWLPALAVLAPWAAAKKDAPLVETTDFDSELANIFYFDDSDVAMFFQLDSEKVFRSKDAGKSWMEQKGMRTMGIIKNPFDNKVAVVLGEKKHWITYDQGEKWTEFETEVPPTLGNPLSFHAADSKRILFHGDAGCSFFSVCLGKVSCVRSRPRLKANAMSHRLTTRRMALTRSQSSLGKAGRCACGRKVPKTLAKATTRYKTGYCA